MYWGQEQYPWLMSALISMYSIMLLLERSDELQRQDKNSGTVTLRMLLSCLGIYHRVLVIDENIPARPHWRARRSDRSLWKN